MKLLRAMISKLSQMPDKEPNADNSRMFDIRIHRDEVYCCCDRYADTSAIRLACR